MSIKDPYLYNINKEVHLRDARHAHQLYTSHNFALAPKTKFLYHVVFETYDEVGTPADNNTVNFSKEIGVLVKTADLPGYRASIENKQQYNRKKNMQTRIDYQDVNITFHDDNLGITRGLLQDYYQYYYVDGNHRDPRQGFDVEGRISNSHAQAYQARDKYKEAVPNYGLNNGKVNPFFKNIRIYQLARRDWFAYTLINPLLSSFDHGDMDASAGGEFNENKITVAYEAVVYSNGSVGENGEPIAFTDPETNYDVVDSPIGYFDKTMSAKNTYARDKALFDPKRQKRNSILPRSNNNPSRRDSLFSRGGAGTGIIGAGLRDLFSGNAVGGLLGSRIPSIDTQQNNTPSTMSTGNRRILDGDSIRNNFNTLPSAKNSYIARALNINSVVGETLSTFNSASTTRQTAIETELIDRAAGGDRKLAEIATDSIDSTKGGILT